MDHYRIWSFFNLNEQTWTAAGIGGWVTTNSIATRMQYLRFLKTKLYKPVPYLWGFPVFGLQGRTRLTGGRDYKET
jgi:hypothetical protein